MESISELLEWSNNEEKIEYFCSNRKGKLPCVVIVTEGYLGVKDPIGRDEMFYLFNCENQTRVVVRNFDTKEIFSIPIDCTVKFHRFSSPNIGNIMDKPLTLKTIIGHWRINENKRWIAAEKNCKFQYFVDATCVRTGALGLLEILETFDLKYVLGLPMSDEGISKKAEAIPDFLNISLKSAVGTVHGDGSAFNQWMKRLKKIVESLNLKDYNLYNEVIKFERIQYRSAAQHYQYIRGAVLRDINNYERLVPGKRSTNIIPSYDNAESSDEDEVSSDSSIPLPKLPGSKSAKILIAPRIARRPRAPTPKEESVTSDQSLKDKCLPRVLKPSIKGRPRMPTPT